MAVKFSVIIPVYREQANINRVIDRLRTRTLHDELEIIVVDGSSGAETLQAIKDAGVKKLISSIGRGRQQNAGAAGAAGDILIFLHADTILPDGALERVTDAMKDAACVGGAFDLVIDSERFAYLVIEKMASWRSRLTRIPYGDQAIFIRADYFRKMGGFKEIPLMEDVDLMRRIKKDKARIVILKDRVLTSARRWENEGVVFCTLRNWLLVLLYLAGIKPETLARFYK